MELPKRKTNRLQNCDYSSPGYYFITICTEDKKNLLCSIVEGGALGAPQVSLSHIGRIVQSNIESSNRIPHIRVDKYVIMPNHIHLIICIDAPCTDKTLKDPSPANAVIPHYVSTLKRFCNKAAGQQLFQRSYHDHVIRGERDYQKIWEHIETNPIKWQEDCFYAE